MTRKFPKEFNYYDKYCVTCGHDTCGGIQESFYLKEDIDEWKKQDDKKKEDLKKYLEKVIAKLNPFRNDIRDYVIYSSQAELAIEILKRLES